jgi:uncharacterized protein
MRTLILATAIMCIAAVGMRAQQPDMRRTVVIEGSAEASMTPDRASITIGVETEGKDAATVKKDNDRAIRGIFESLASAGIDAKDIQTSNLTLEPVYNWRPEGRREFVKYVMRNTVHVTIRDLAKLDRVLDVAVTKGGNLINSIDFEVSNANAVRDSLRAAAARNAKAKAQQLAEAVGAKVGKVLQLSEMSSPQPMPVFRKAMMMADAESAPTVAAGQMEIKVIVNATFELE